MPMYEAQTEGDRKKIDAIVDFTADRGPGANIQKWRSIDKKARLWEMKPTSEVRMPYFWHPDIQRVIVITHVFIKKGRKLPPSERVIAVDRSKDASGSKIIGK